MIRYLLSIATDTVGKNPGPICGNHTLFRRHGLSHSAVDQFQTQVDS